MGRLNPAYFPSNVQEIVNETKPVILKKLSDILGENEILKNIATTNSKILPTSVQGLVTKTRQELLEIIARKDDVEVQQQCCIKAQVEEINKLSNDNKELSFINHKLVKDYRNVQIELTVSIIIWLITIFCYFVL